jgi:hypothetical protein
MDINITGELCVADTELTKLRRNNNITRKTLRVRTPWGIREKVFALLHMQLPTTFKRNDEGEMVRVPGRRVERWADVVTGTLYCPRTGQSASPSLWLEVAA